MGFPSEETIKKRIETKRLGYPPICDYDKLKKKAKVKKNKIDWIPIFIIVMFITFSVSAWVYVDHITKIKVDRILHNPDNLAKNRDIKFKFEQPVEFTEVEIAKAKMKRMKAEAQFEKMEYLMKEKLAKIEAETTIRMMYLKDERAMKLYEAETQRMVDEILEKK